MNDNDELTHYGILGMRWGVRRTRAQLDRASTKDGRDKAISKLNKYRTKGAAEIDKLKKKGVKLEKQSENLIIKNETKAANLNKQAAKKRSKMYGFFTSQEEAKDLEFQAKKLEARANELIASSKNAKAKVESNSTMIKAFQREIDNIDDALVKAGKKYLLDN